MEYSHKGILFRLLCAAALLVGYAGTASASTCSTSDVILFDGIIATDCGIGSSTNDGVSPPPGNWLVNTDGAGDINGDNLWAAWMKSEITEAEDEFGQPINNPEAANTEWSEYNADGTGDGSVLDLKFTDYTGTCDTIADPTCVPELYSEGEFSVIVPDDGKLLIVLKDGAKNSTDGYHWYYFEGLIPGLNTGSVWNTENALGGNNISHMTAYTTIQANPIPVPAAVWLFGSGLLGLAGIARRKS
ncbi:MAG: VPLPA-CTERM sorting domain-containing protein [Gammaproteobacteria bacterium]|nr:VPLPA-CTERM sorting domain-containing protein [Gammaproteobacteria bacterium]